MLGVVSHTRFSVGNRTHYPHAIGLAHYTQDYQDALIRILDEIDLRSIIILNILNRSLQPFS